MLVYRTESAIQLPSDAMSVPASVADGRLFSTSPYRSVGFTRSSFTTLSRTQRQLQRWVRCADSGQINFTDQNQHDVDCGTNAPGTAEPSEYSPAELVVYVNELACIIRERQY